MSKKNLVKNIFSVGLIQIANYVFPMISIPIVSRVIGPENFGVINFSSAYIAYFTLLIGFGFDLTATRKVAVDPQNEQNRNLVFSEVVHSRAWLLLISALFFIGSMIFVPQLNQEREVAIYSFLICFSTVLAQNWLFQAMQDLSKVAFLSLASKVVFTVCILIVIRHKPDYKWYPLVFSVSQILLSLASFVWAIKKYKLKLLKVSARTVVGLLWQEKIFFFSLCVINLYTTTNVVILGLFQDSAQVGYYTAGQKLVSILQAMIALPLSHALFPYIGKAFGEDYKSGVDIVQKLFPIVFLIGVCATIGIFFASPFFVSILYGESFAAAVGICRILAFVPMLIALGTLMGIHVMLNLKMDSLLLRITCFGAVMSILANLVFVKIFGAIGSAMIWTMTEMLNSLMMYFFLRKRGIDVVNFKYFKAQYLFSYIGVIRNLLKGKG